MRPCSSSARSIAAVDDDRLTRGEAACAAREKDRGPRDFFGLADAAKRRAARRYFQRVGIFPQRPREVGLDEAGRDAIHANALPPESSGEVKTGRGAVRKGWGG